MAKPSRVASLQANNLSDIRLLILALCEKANVNVDEVLGTTEPQTREQMKAYATKLPAPEPAQVKPKRAAKVSEE